MWDESKMVPMSQALRMLTTGFEWEAGLFIEVYKELSERLGKEAAKEVLAKAMYRTGLKLGEEARALADSNDTIGMARAWDVIYGAGTDAAEVLDKDRFIIRGQGCAAFDLFQRWGVPDEEIRFFADAYCVGDVGHAEGFGGEEMDFQHTHRLMRGDEYCIWDFSMEPLEPAEGAAKKPALDEE
jgi:hypothetical protein